LNEISRRTNKNKRKVISQLAYLERTELVKSFKDKNKKLYELTSKGRDACAYYRIRQEAGYSGIEWAKNLFTKGYKVRFLQDLTGLPGHRRWLFAWNPHTRDVDMALIFGTKSISREGDSPAYIAQYVDRERNPKEPIRHDVLFDFIKNNVNDFENEQQLTKALKSFWDPNMHNSFMCLLLPEEVTFGFPHEIGHFSSMILSGFGYQETVPFIPKMDFAAGTFDLGKNFRAGVHYSINLIAQYILLWLNIRKEWDPPSDPAEKRELERIIEENQQKLYGTLIDIKYSCKNYTGEKCRKMGIDCLALEDRQVNFTKCPILMDEIRQVKLTFERVNDLSHSVSSSIGVKSS
jgi:hypothetical protein